MTSFSLAVVFVLRTGVSWRDLHSCFGNWHTVYTRFKRVRENGLFWSLLYRLQQRKKIKMDLVWIDSTTVSLHPHGSGVLKKQNSPLGGEERAEALKIHVGLSQGFLCGACLSASNKLDMTVFNELWARGNWDEIVHVVADKGYDCSSVTRSYQKTGENTRYPQAQGGHLSRRVRSRALKNTSHRRAILCPYQRT